MKNILVAALLIGTATPTMAATLVVPGNTTGQPTYHRLVNITTLSAVGTAVRFQITEFVVDQSGSYVMTLLSLTNAYDPFLALYGGGFLPSQPLGDILALDDDLNGDRTRSQVEIQLTAGQGYQAVVSGFDNQDFGAYSLTFDGPGTIVADNGTAVPEPATWGLMLIGFGLVGAAMRYRRRSTVVAFG